MTGGNEVPMKPPGPPPPPPSNRRTNDPSSGRERKDVNYARGASASYRANAPVPSAPQAPENPAHLDSGEDATPMRLPTVGSLEALNPATRPVEWKPEPIPTGPMEPIAPPAPAPPPSHRHFAPPASAPHMPAISSARVRQSAPVDAPPYTPPYPSQQGPVTGPVSGHQITGPQLPVPMHHPPTGSFQVVTGTHAPRLAPNADEGMHLGYVVASAFFLAIALVGFGLYLAFEVISL